MPATGLLLICLVSVVSLAVFIGAVLLADRSPYFRRQHVEARRGRVQGGTHVGGGRSVAPRRDAPVIPGEDPEGSTVPGRPGRPGSGSGNPLDL